MDVDGPAVDDGVGLRRLRRKKHGEAQPLARPRPPPLPTGPPSPPRLHCRRRVCLGCSLLCFICYKERLGGRTRRGPSIASHKDAVLGLTKPPPELVVCHNMLLVRDACVMSIHLDAYTELATFVRMSIYQEQPVSNAPEPNPLCRRRLHRSPPQAVESSLEIIVSCIPASDGLSHSPFRVGSLLQARGSFSKLWSFASAP